MQIFRFAIVLAAFAWTTATADDGKTRVFITDSHSWSMDGAAV